MWPYNATWASTSTIRLEDCRLDMALKNLAIVRSSPRIDVTAMIPTNKKATCWDQNRICKTKVIRVCSLLDLPTNIDLVSQVLYNYLDSFRDGVHLPNPVKNDVDGAYQNLPDTIHGEEVTDHVEVLPLPRLWVFDPVLNSVCRFACYWKLWLRGNTRMLFNSTSSRNKCLPNSSSDSVSLCNEL